MLKENYPYGMKRHPVVRRLKSCPLVAIAFENREWANFVTHPVNVSMTGLGVESDLPIKPGIIWFKDDVWGYKCGVLVWCKYSGVRYRAGIQFVPLNKHEEEYLRQQVERAQPNKPLQDPRQLIKALTVHAR
jgi:hypothetical protein